MFSVAMNAVVQLKYFLRRLLSPTMINWMYDCLIVLKKWVVKKRVIVFLQKQGVALFGPESLEIVEWLRTHPLSVFPYEFSNKYTSEDVVVHVDPNSGLCFVDFHEKKLFFKRGLNEATVKQAFSNLMREQDFNSPHLYIDVPLVDVVKGDVVVDVGAAEGIFALSIIDRASEVFLIECDELWAEALQFTFEPYRDKVHIITKYVSNKNDGLRIATLDTLLGERSVNFIKADIEGSEKCFLYGAKKTILRSRELKMALCVYHRQNDEKEISKVLNLYGFTTYCSKRYMLFYEDTCFTPPYLRRGVVRALRCDMEGS